MVFKFIPDFQFDFLQEFARYMNLEIRDNSISIRSLLGTGYIKKVTINEKFHIVIHKYNLKEPLLLKRIPSADQNEILTFRFVSHDVSDKEYLSNIQIFNYNVGIDDYIAPNTNISYVVISIHKKQLMSLIDFDGDMGWGNSFFEQKDIPFLFQENMSFEMKKIMVELSEMQHAGKLEKLYYKSGIMQLLYLFFTKLTSREIAEANFINKADITKILTIEKLILGNLSTPPSLPDLAQTIGMSPTKMKRLYKIIFGDSIYNYYQSARMSEAASLLKNNKDLSVSDVGYSLGFSNLGHFSQLFKKYTGLKPKEYSSQYRRNS